LYTAGSNYVDDQINRLVVELKQKDLYDETLILITSDHGEMFNEYEIPDDLAVQHPNNLSDYITRVPLVFAGGSLPNRTINGIASGIDIAPTIASLVGIDVPDKWEGVIIDSNEYKQRNHVYSVTGCGKRQDNKDREDIPRDTLHVSLRTTDDAVLWWSGGVKSPEFYDRTEHHSDPTIREIKVKNMNPADKSEYIDVISEKFPKKIGRCI
jgi:arylsulfatase A-like enzyme